MDCDASNIVCSDFNIPSNRKLSRYQDLMSERGLNQCVNSPTGDNNIYLILYLQCLTLLSPPPRSLPVITTRSILTLCFYFQLFHSFF